MRTRNPQLAGVCGLVVRWPSDPACVEITDTGINLLSDRDDLTPMSKRTRRKDGGTSDRAWSAHTSVPPRGVGTDLALSSALPAETGPTWAPDRLSVWPVEGGRYGVDAHYHGQTGYERACGQRDRLAKAGVTATVRREGDGSIIRLGPLAHAATWVALEAFLGRPPA